MADIPIAAMKAVAERLDGLGLDYAFLGGSPMSSYIARKVVQWFQKRPSAGDEVHREGLSPREQEILRLLARGKAYKEMADILGVSMGTINTHTRRIYHKLHVSSRGEAVSLFSPFPSEPRAPKQPS